MALLVQTGAEVDSLRQQNQELIYKYGEQIEKEDVAIKKIVENNKRVNEALINETSIEIGIQKSNKSHNNNNDSMEQPIKSSIVLNGLLQKRIKSRNLLHLLIIIQSYKLIVKYIKIDKSFSSLNFLTPFMLIYDNFWLNQLLNVYIYI